MLQMLQIRRGLVTFVTNAAHVTDVTNPPWTCNKCYK